MVAYVNRIGIVDAIPKRVVKPIIHITGSTAELLCPNGGSGQRYDITAQLNPTTIDPATKEMGLYVIGSKGEPKNYALIGDRAANPHGARLVKIDMTNMNDLGYLNSKDTIFTVNLESNGSAILNDFRSGFRERLDANSAERALSDYGIIYLKMKK